MEDGARKAAAEYYRKNPFLLNLLEPEDVTHETIHEPETPEKQKANTNKGVYDPTDNTKKFSSSKSPTGWVNIQGSSVKPPPNQR
jgi:hypothetical protein